MAVPQASEPIMLRVSAKAKEMFQELVKEQGVSQNTLLGASLFQIMLACGKLEVEGDPDNLLRLLDEIDVASSSGEDDPMVYGAFHVSDWQAVLPHIKTFEDFGYIDNFRHKEADTTMAYRFDLSRTGVSAFSLITSFYRAWIACRKSIGVQANPPPIRKRLVAPVA